MKTNRHNETITTNGEQKPDYTAAIAFVAGVGGVLALSVAGNIVVERLQEGPANCVQESDDLLPALSVSECIDDIFGY